MILNLFNYKNQFSKAQFGMKIVDKQTIRIPLILTAALISFATGIYVFFSYFREQEFYAYLQSTAITRSRLIFDAGVTADQFKAVDVDLKESAYLLHQYIIYDTLGNILYTSKNAKPHLDEKYKKLLFKTPLKFEKDGFERTLFLNKENAKHQTFILEAAGYDMAGFQKQKSLLLNLLIASGLLILIIVVVSRYFIKKDLKPLGKIADRMRKISSKNLHDRLPEAKLRNEIGQMSVTFNSLLDRLETSYAQQLNFVSYVTHELRTPLAILLGNAQVTLMKQRNVEEYKQTINEFLVDINSMTDLTNNLLDLARMNADSQSISFIKLRIDEIVFNAAESLKRKKPECIINIEFEEIHESEEDFWLEGNSELLTLAMRNLMENGCKYSHFQPIEVKIGSFNHTILIKIIDKGMGISDDEQKNIFEAFYRSQKNLNISGHGIGLPLTKRIIEIHSGAISIQSTIGEGTTFTVELPSK